MYRILVTGSRDWDDRDHIEDIITLWAYMNGLPKNVTLVSGACPTGADKLAEEFFISMGLPIERYPADWSEHGRSAGFVRNQQMVDTKPDICFAFIKNGSKGATHTAQIAKLAGIPTFIAERND